MRVRLGRGRITERLSRGRKSSAHPRQWRHQIAHQAAPEHRGPNPGLCSRSFVERPGAGALWRRQPHPTRLETTRSVREDHNPNPSSQHYQADGLHQRDQGLDCLCLDAQSSSAPCDQPNVFSDSPWHDIVANSHQIHSTQITDSSFESGSSVTRGWPQPSPESPAEHRLVPGLRTSESKSCDAWARHQRHDWQTVSPHHARCGLVFYGKYVITFTSLLSLLHFMLIFIFLELHSFASSPFSWSWLFLCTLLLILLHRISRLVPPATVNIIPSYCNLFLLLSFFFNLWPRSHGWLVRKWSSNHCVEWYFSL